MSVRPIILSTSCFEGAGWGGIAQRCNEDVHCDDGGQVKEEVKESVSCKTPTPRGGASGSQLRTTDTRTDHSHRDQRANDRQGEENQAHRQ